MKNEKLFEDLAKNFASRTIGQLKESINGVKPRTAEEALFQELMLAGLDKALNGINPRNAGTKPQPATPVNKKARKAKTVKKKVAAKSSLKKKKRIKRKTSLKKAGPRK